MAANAGRNVTITYGGTAIAGVRVKGLSIAGSPIDITSDDDSGWRALLGVAGQVDVNISVSGIKLNDTLLNLAVDPDSRQAALVLTYSASESPTRSVSGTFELVSYNEGHEYQGAGTFDAELQSSGTVTVTG